LAERTVESAVLKRANDPDRSAGARRESSTQVSSALQ
jgi:hypothetical protein